MGIDSDRRVWLDIWPLVAGLEHDFYDFPYIGKNSPNWPIFFRGVQTTNQDQLNMIFGVPIGCHFSFDRDNDDKQS